jgi:peptide/nickel transport system ATP-binding protein
MAKVLEIKALTVGFDTQAGIVRVVDNMSLDCDRNEIIAVLGESGCGKSVLAGAIMRILDANAWITGQILLNTLDILSLCERKMANIRGNQISIIMQNPDSALNPVLPIGTQLAECLWTHTTSNKQEAIKTILERLKAMGFKEGKSLLKMFPHQLSGGMKQRLLISAALLTGPEMIIADEPSKGLDPLTKELVMAEMKKLCHQQQSGLMLITHDTQVARKMANRVAVMYAGEIVEIAECQRFFKTPLHPYSRALLNSSPEKGFHPIPGFSPSPDQLPSGCRFHPRCPDRKVQCDTINPEMRPVYKDRVKCHLY